LLTVVLPPAVDTGDSAIEDRVIGDSVRIAVFVTPE
jgi:hypothetical protein